ncbi:MAG: DUF4296 domain-containing protein [Cytophagales bacterium]|nr:DUF4296 domain-containing protein [Cytophagales bacterium]
MIKRISGNGGKSIWVSLLFFGVLSAACSSKEAPVGVLTPEQMIPIFLDVYLAEGKVNEMRVKRDSSLALFEVYEQYIFEKHNVADSTYRLSMSYYYDHPDQLEMIYETVLDSLNLLEKRLEEKEKEELKNGDGEDEEETKPKKVVDA